eukprot:3156292-Pyramimonas_sp.AAC.1
MHCVSHYRAVLVHIDCSLKTLSPSGLMNRSLKTMNLGKLRCGSVRQAQSKRECAIAAAMRGRIFNQQIRDRYATA